MLRIGLNSDMHIYLLIHLSDDWQINTVKHLYKQYTFQNFVGTMKFANNIAIIAEQEVHHPDLTISCDACAVAIWTPKIKGLTKSDFILTTKIEAIE